MVGMLSRGAMSGNPEVDSVRTPASSEARSFQTRTTSMTTLLDRHDDVARNVAAADPAILLASLIGITGQVCQLERFASQLTHHSGLHGIGSALPQGPRDELEAWALAVLGNLDWYAHRDPLDVDNIVFARLVQVVTGSECPAVTLDHLREQCGFSLRGAVRRRTGGSPLPEAAVTHRWLRRNVPAYANWSDVRTAALTATLHVGSCGRSSKPSSTRFLR